MTQISCEPLQALPYFATPAEVAEAAGLKIASLRRAIDGSGAGTRIERQKLVLSPDDRATVLAWIAAGGLSAST